MAVGLVLQQQYELALQIRETSVVINKSPAQIEPPPWDTEMPAEEIGKAFWADNTPIQPKIPPTMIKTKATEVGVTEAAQWVGHEGGGGGVLRSLIALIIPKAPPRMTRTKAIANKAIEAAPKLAAAWNVF